MNPEPCMQCTESLGRTSVRTKFSDRAATLRSRPLPGRVQALGSRFQVLGSRFQGLGVRVVLRV